MAHVNTSISVPEEIFEEIEKAQKTIFPHLSRNGFIVHIFRAFLANKNAVSLMIHELNKPKLEGEVKGDND